MSSIQFTRSSTSVPVEAEIWDGECDNASVSSIHESLERYSMLPLDREAREVRLLELLPAPSTEVPIECKLFVVSRWDGPIYSTLSYTWGNERHEMPIRVNGRDWFITENLFLALSHLRDREKPLVLWVDAICIDQHNDDEKSWHVREMRQTFAEADCSLLWLGSGSPATDAALEMLNSIGAKAASLGSSEAIWGVETASKIVGLLQEASDKVQIRSGDANASSLLHLMRDIVEQNEDGLHFREPATQDIFNRPWWKRVWVVQEIAVSKKARVVCGYNSIPFSNINVSAAIYYHYRTSVWGSNRQVPLMILLFSPEVLSMQSLWVQLTLRWAYLNHRQKPGIPLAFLLSSTFTYGSTRVLEATDPRDYVFALLGMASDSDTMGLTANYSESNESVYTNLAWKLIQNHQFITLSWCRPTEKKTNHLPSWVPDFAYKIHRPFQWVSYASKSNEIILEPEYNASANLRGPQPELIKSPFAQILRMHGIVFDLAVHCGASWEELYERHIQQPHIRERVSIRWLREAKMSLEDAGNSRGVHKSHTAAESVWKSSVAGMFMKPSWERMRSHGGLPTYQLDLYNEEFPYEKMVGMPELQQHFTLMESTNIGRRPFLSKLGYMGLGPIEMKPGDSVVVLCGVQMPMVVRPVANGQWRLLGDTYLHGIMDGLPESGNLEPEAVELV